MILRWKVRVNSALQRSDMANHHRGDVDLHLSGATFALRLTLGALAEIETAFAAPDLVALGERLQGGRFAARDLIPILGAAARGGGTLITDKDLAGQISAADLDACIDAVARLFVTTFGNAA